MTSSGASPLPLLYTNPVPLDAARDRDLGLRARADLGFTRSLHAVPVNALEMVDAAAHYPLVFSPDASATPVAVLGLVEKENLFLDGQGAWQQNAYIPAYIRRYPFLLATLNDTDQMALCVDQAPGVCDTASGTEPFFDESGAPTPLTRGALEFCQSFHAATLATREFSAALEASGILVARSAEIPLADGTSRRFSGFRVIDPEKWAALPDEVVLTWRRQGWLAPVHAGLFSAARWDDLARLYVARHPRRAA